MSKLSSLYYFMYLLCIENTVSLIGRHAWPVSQIIDVTPDGRGRYFTDAAGHLFKHLCRNAQLRQLSYLMAKSAIIFIDWSSTVWSLDCQEHIKLLDRSLETWQLKRVGVQRSPLWADSAFNFYCSDFLFVAKFCSEHATRSSPFAK